MFHSCSPATETVHTQGLGPEMVQAFQTAEGDMGVRCWWWWLNGNVTKEAITRDLEAMKSKGYSGAMIFDAGGADQRGNAQVPAGPLYGSPEWVVLFKHALSEAKRLGLELGLSVQSGWNLGGPNVTPDFAAKKLCWAETSLKGGHPYKGSLPTPEHNPAFYQDICVLAFPSVKKGEPIRDLVLKSAFREMGGSATDTRSLLSKEEDRPDDQPLHPDDILDITDKLTPSGELQWDIPEGDWTILRMGYTVTGAHVSTSSGDWKGLVIDYLSKEAFDRYWKEVVDPLLEAAGPMAGTVLKQLETDSWECGGMNWSPKFAEEFKQFTNYNITPYLPVIAGFIVENREASNAFLADFRKTIGHCIAENHYGQFAEKAHALGMQIQPESGGPHVAPIDAIMNLGKSDIVMGEFWAPSPHRPNPENRFFIKQASSVAHVYGKKYIAAEGFTTIGPQWNDVLWRDQKPSIDHEFCSGLNLLFFHTFTCSPKEMGIPGQEYFAGTHVNPQVTWWEYADPFIDYINRCQLMVQNGDFVADALYYTGDHVPNLSKLKESDPARVMPGFDYDLCSEEILLQLTVKDGQIWVPGGIHYRILVLPDHQVLSLEALKKVDKLIRKGATILGQKPIRLVSLIGGDKAQKEFRKISDKLWGAEASDAGDITMGKGRLVWGSGGHGFLSSEGYLPDFEYKTANQDLKCDYIHYTNGGDDYYFVANQSEVEGDVTLVLRTEGRQPEIWDPLTGSIRYAQEFSEIDGSISIPVTFEPNGSLFIVFRRAISDDFEGAGKNFLSFTSVQELKGSWTLFFDPRWGGREMTRFDSLMDWTRSRMDGIRYYSGKALYTKSFDLDIDQETGCEYWLDLGQVEDVGIAHVMLNGEDLGVVWTPPFRVNITDVVNRSDNRLEVTVINSWRNRLVGDRGKEQQDRYTQTNITIRDDWELIPSGLLGPVRIMERW